MTNPPTVPAASNDQFPQHPRLAELVHGLRFERYPLFLAGLVYEEPDGGLRRAAAAATRDGALLAYDSGDFYEYGGRVPASRLFDDDLVDRSEKARFEALAELNREFFAHEVAAWTDGRRSVNEVGIELLRRSFPPDEPPLAVTHGEVLGVIPLEVTDALLELFRQLADRRDRGFLVEQVMELLAAT